MRDAEARAKRPKIPERVIDYLILHQNEPATAYVLAFKTSTYFGWMRRAVKKMVEEGELEVVKADHHNINLYRLP